MGKPRRTRFLGGVLLFLAVTGACGGAAEHLTSTAGRPQTKSLSARNDQLRGALAPAHAVGMSAGSGSLSSYGSTGAGGGSAIAEPAAVLPAVQPKVIKTAD